MSESFIALGANLGQPLQQLQSAIKALQQLEQSVLLAQSPWYRSVAIGPGDQPDYINGVVKIETGLQPEQLLAALQTIENDHGRERSQRWGARTLDLDILLFGDLELDTDTLCIPHPRMTERAFVLYPLFDLNPDLILPCGTPLESLLAHCPAEGLRALDAGSGDEIDPGS